MNLVWKFKDFATLRGLPEMTGVQLAHSSETAQQEWYDSSPYIAHLFLHSVSLSVYPKSNWKDLVTKSANDLLV